MKKLITLLMAAFLVLGSYGVLLAAVIDFEDVPGANSATWDNPIPDGYYGFNWDQMDVLQEDYHPGSGYDYGVTSGEWVAYNVYDNTAFISDGLFDFTGAWFTSAWDSTNDLTITGYNSGSEIYNTTITLNNLTPTWFQADWLGVDTLEFSTVGYHFAMDDFTYNESAPVPEPSTIMLSVLGLIGMAGYCRKRYSKKG